MLEPWKIMLALAGLLVVFGVLQYFQLSGPAEIALALLLGSFFAITTWVGYRIGRQMDFGEE